jgi:hypothetical protein
VWCGCVSLPRGACGRWGGNMCRSVCVGVLERGIGSFEMQLPRSTRDTCASHPSRSFSFLGFLEDRALSLFFLTPIHPCFSTTPKALFLQPPVLGGALLSSPRPAPRAILERSPKDNLILRISMLFLLRRKNEAPCRHPVNVTPGVPFKNYNEALRCRFAWSGRIGR